MARSKKREDTVTVFGLTCTRMTPEQREEHDIDDDDVIVYVNEQDISVWAERQHGKNVADDFWLISISRWSDDKEELIEDHSAPSDTLEEAEQDLLERVATKMKTYQRVYEKLAVKA